MRLTREELRQEALELIDRDIGNMTLRSCWRCNPAHAHLRQVKSVVINCYECGKYYYLGTDITVNPEGD